MKNIFIRTILLFVLIASISKKYAYAVDNNEINDLRKAKICNLSAEAAINQFHWISDNWFNPKKSSYAIDSNFENVTKVHESFFDYLNNFGRFLSLKVSSLEGLREERLNLEKEYRNAYKLFADSDIADMSFSSSAASLESAVLSLRHDVLYLVLECPEYKDQVPKLEKTLNDWFISVNKYRSFIDQAKKKRMVLFDTAYRLSSLGFTNALHELAVDNLNDAQKKMMATLEIDVWHTKVQAWWTVVGVKDGIGSGLHTKYLQFLPALRKMHSNLGEIVNFEEEFKKLPNSQKHMGLLEELASYRSLITSEINRLTEEGWKGQLRRQIILSKARRKVSTSIPCAEAISVHLQSADSASTLEAFKETEILYALSVDICSKQGDGT